MSRLPRAQMPGAAFHITARLHGKEPWFQGGLEKAVEECIVEGVATSNALLLAHTVMSNHFHVVLKQGSRPLGWVMQPICRRIALMVQRKRGYKGHVFERPFRSHLCWNADYLRRAITYTHLNPVRANICERPEAYPWTSHMRLILQSDVGVSAIEVAHVLRLFGNSPDDDERQLRHNYAHYVEWRLRKDRQIDDGMPFVGPEPDSLSGDRYFAAEFCGGPAPNRILLRDLRDKALDILADIAPQQPMGELRVRWLPRPLVEVRRQLIAALLQAGYAGNRIAEFLRISNTAVSAVASAMRNQCVG